MTKEAGKLTAELTDGCDERASLSALRLVLGVPAHVVGTALALATASPSASRRAGYRLPVSSSAFPALPRCGLPREGSVSAP